MKKILFGTFVLFVVINTMVQSQDCCVWSEFFDSIECGIRRTDDQLLFNDIRTSNWTTGIENRLGVTYNNIYITYWRAELDPNWYVFSYSAYFPYFRVSAQVNNATQAFTISVTGYGYPYNNTEVPYDSLRLQDGEQKKHTFTYHNPKYQ